MRRIGWRCWATVLLCLGLSVPAVAQVLSSARPSATNPPQVQGAVKIGTEDYNRLMEILVELAWLADPATFLCPLEARVNGGALQVTGHVPNRAAHERAVQIARLHCAMTVLDGVQETMHPAVSPAQVQPEQLQHAASTLLHDSFASHEHLFKVQCDTEGRIRLLGFVGSFEEKLAVSRALRHLGGCSSVMNETHVTTDLQRTPLAAETNVGPAQPQAQAAPSGNVQTAQYAAVAPNKQSAPWSENLNLGEPYVSHGTVLVDDTAEARAEETILQKHIAQACGISAARVKVQKKPGDKLDIELTLSNPLDYSRFSQRILQLPDVRTFQVNIRFKKAD